MGVRNRVASPFFISHPYTLFSYYVLLLCCIFIFKNPLVIAIVFLICCALALYYAGFEAFKNTLKWSLVIGVVVLVMNILLVHRGSSVITYFLDNPITKEAIVYGIYNMFMIMSVMMIFVSFNALIDSSAFLYIFSGILPKTSFMLDMALRYLPLFKNRAADLYQVQTVNSIGQGSKWRDKLKDSGTYLKALTAWTLEEGMQTALSLKVKHYGSGKKTHYEQYRLTLRDIAMLCVFLSSFIVFIVYAIKGETSFTFYPTLDSFIPDAENMYFLLIILSVLMLPFLLELAVLLRRSINWLSQKNR